MDIERAIEYIPIYESRVEFEAVYRLYSIRNYRACIVMLWSCIICDLLRKLEISKLEHNDTVASSILTNTNRNGTGDDFRSDWETEFIRELKQRTKFFTDIAFEQIKDIHKHRHWCAHPVFNDNISLYSPSKDLCREEMEQAMNIVLLRPPFMTKKITEMVLALLPILQKKDYDYDTVCRFLDEKYLRNLPCDLTQRLFKDMWHIVYCVEEDEEAEKNRRVGFWTIKHLIEINPTLINLIEKETDYFSRISLKINTLKLFFLLTCSFPEIWNNISQPSRTLIKGEVADNHILDFYASCLDNDIKSHFERLLQEPFIDNDGSFFNKMRFLELCSSDVNFFIEHIEDKETLNVLCEFLIKVHTTSNCFDNANKTFAELIKPFINFFSKDNIETLLLGINNNDQCYNRGSCFDSIKCIKNKCDIDNYIIDIEKYPHISCMSLIFAQKCD